MHGPFGAGATSKICDLVKCIHGKCAGSSSKFKFTILGPTGRCMALRAGARSKLCDLVGAGSSSKCRAFRVWLSSGWCTTRSINFNFNSKCSSAVQGASLCTGGASELGSSAVEGAKCTALRAGALLVQGSSAEKLVHGPTGRCTTGP